MNPQERAKLPAHKQLELFLIENGYPSNHIPKLLEYCPRLLNKYSIDAIALAALSEVSTFKPAKNTIYIRPFVLQAVRQEVGNPAEVVEFVETAIAMFCNDTMEITFSDMIETILKEKQLS